MKIILKESVNHLGRSGDVVKVSPGYARNYLIPKGVALMATSENMKVLEAQQAEISAREAEKKKAAEEMQKQIQAVKLEIKAETNEEDQLFGSVGVSEIVKIFADNGVTVDKRDVILPSGNITELGTFPVEVICHIDVVAKMEINVVK